MSELSNSIYTEKYRSSSFGELIFEDKQTLLNYLKKPLELPSFIFHSSSPGTGKTSCSKLISKVLECDTLILNSSDERGIDVIRDKIKLFAQSLSSNNNTKRMIFMDEMDGTTSIAQNSLRVTMEEYSSNCFFVFSCNDINKIIEPIRSRCVLFSFERPSKKQIFDRLEYICKEENIEYDPEDLSQLINLNYPDIRSMVMTLQSTKIDSKSLLVDNDEYREFFKYLLLKDIQSIYSKSFSNSFNLMGFNRWLFHYIFYNQSLFSFSELSCISMLLADTEKNYNLGVNLPILFIANMLEVAEIISKKSKDFT